MLYSFESKINDKDYYDFNKYVFLHSPGSRKKNIIRKLYLPFLFLIMIIFNILIDGEDWDLLSFRLIVYGTSSLIWFFSITPLTLLIFKLNIRINGKKGKLPYSDTATMEFYDDYFTETTKTEKSEISYDAITRISVGKNKSIYIFKNTIQAFIIPFNAFSSDNEYNNFIKFITEKAKKQIV